MNVFTRISRGLLSLAVAAALGFGATQAFASSTQPVDNDACTSCAQQCGTIKLCYPGYCECA